RTAGPGGADGRPLQASQHPARVRLGRRVSHPCEGRGRPAPDDPTRHRALARPGHRVMVGVAAKDPRGLIPGWAFDLLTEDFRKKHHTSHAYTDTDPP